jgi:hypothetical protein
MLVEEIQWQLRHGVESHEDIVRAAGADGPAGPGATAGWERRAA